MTPQARAAFRDEMTAARACYRDGDLDAAFRHLERAHILGQRDTLRHTWSHGWMLRVGWARRDGREIRGQLLRIVGALLILGAARQYRRRQRQPGAAHAAAGRPAPAAGRGAALVSVPVGGGGVPNQSIIA